MPGPRSRWWIWPAMAALAWYGIDVFVTHAPPSSSKSKLAPTSQKDLKFGIKPWPTPGSAVSFDDLLAQAARDLTGFTAWLRQHLAALTPDQRTEFLRELARRWTDEWWNGGPFASAFRALVASDPVTASQLLDLFPTVAVRDVLIETLVASWAAKDPVAVERWMATISDGDDRATARRSLAEARLRRNPAEAMQWASERLAAAGDPAIVQELVLGFAAADPRAAVAWTESLEKGTVKSRATVSLASAWAATDGAAASQWATTLPQSEMRDDAVTAVAQIWGATKPQQAIAYFGQLQFTDAGARNAAYRDFAETLSLADADTALQWAEKLPAAADSDAALAGIAQGLFEEDPARAFGLTLRIKDAVARASASGEIMEQWRSVDAEAAEHAAAAASAARKKAP